MLINLDSIITQKLREAFDSSYEIRQSSFSYPGANVVEFFTEDGKKYLIINEKNPMVLSNTFNSFYSEALGRDYTAYKLDFFMLKDSNQPPHPGNIVQIKSSTPYAIKIFSTVINHARAFYSNINDIDLLIISAFQGEDGRLPLYTKLIKKIAINLGGVLIGNIEDYRIMGQYFDLTITLKDSTLTELGSNIEEFKNELNIV